MKIALLVGGFALAMSLTATAFAEGTDKAYTRNVAIVIWDGAEILDWGGPSEVFESASRFGQDNDKPAFNVYTVSKTKDPITSQRFVKVLPEYSIADAPKPDIIVLPGGGTSQVMKDPEFLEWASMVARDAEVALSVCTGAFILGTAGLLDGKDATTWFGALDSFERQFPNVTVKYGQRFVDNGQVVTTAGVSAGIDGSLHVVARLLGRYVADQTARYMEYRWTPEPYLSRDYTVLNPSLDERGRRAQQANIYSAEENYTAAIAMYEELLKASGDDLMLWYRSANAYYATKEHKKAMNAYVKASELEHYRVRCFYNAACAAALIDDKDRAFDYLARAIESGLDDREYIAQDDDLKSLREDPRFAQLTGEATP
jgi:putative intracellular protease/amidase